MKMISKIILALMFSFIVNSAFALQPGIPVRNISLLSKDAASQVTLVNLTHESYMAYSVYRGTGQTYSLPLLATGTSQDRIFYPVNYPVYDVCLDVVQNYTNYHVYKGCIASGIIYIHYAADKKTIVVS